VEFFLHCDYLCVIVLVYIFIGEMLDPVISTGIVSPAAILSKQMILQTDYFFLAPKQHNNQRTEKEIGCRFESIKT
jgi:hypothetical protein